MMGEMNICECCGKKFTPSAKAMRNRNYQGRYCSRACANRVRARPFWFRWKEAIRRVEFDPGRGCWLWSGTISKDGYGVIGDDDRRQRLAHREMWHDHSGSPPPVGRRVLHRCDVRACINPDHLFLGSDAENTADRHTKGRDARGERHGRTHLTDADVRAIRAASADGVSQSALGRQYGLTQAAIWAIVHRKTWSHVG